MFDGDVIRIVGDASIARLALAPGDILVVKVDRTIDSRIADRIHASFRPYMPEGVKLMVIDPAIELSILTRADMAALAR